MCVRFASSGIIHLVAYSICNVSKTRQSDGDFRCVETCLSFFYLFGSKPAHDISYHVQCCSFFPSCSAYESLTKLSMENNCVGYVLQNRNKNSRVVPKIFHSLLLVRCSNMRLLSLLLLGLLCFLQVTFSSASADKMLHMQ